MTQYLILFTAGAILSSISYQNGKNDSYVIGYICALFAGVCFIMLAIRFLFKDFSNVTNVILNWIRWLVIG